MKDGKLLQLVDIPGNEKLRSKFTDKFKDSARYIETHLEVVKNLPYHWIILLWFDNLEFH